MSRLLRIKFPKVTHLKTNKKKIEKNKKNKK